MRATPGQRVDAGCTGTQTCCKQPPSAPSARSWSPAHAHARMHCLHEAGELEDVVAGNLSSSQMRGRAVFLELDLLGVAVHPSDTVPMGLGPFKIHFSGLICSSTAGCVRPGRVAGARVVGLGRRKQRARAVVLCAGRAGHCECCAGSSLWAASPSAQCALLGRSRPAVRRGQAGADGCDVDVAGIEQCRRR